jgi:Protein of unknown function (DUF1761)
MTLGNLNYWPILIAAIASFAFGAAWYMALSKQWMAARGKTAADMEKDKAAMGSVPWPFIISFVALLIMAWMLAGVMLHLARGGTPMTIRGGMISGFFLWFGFVITTMATNYAFHDAKRSLTLIDGGHWLGVLLIQGAILGWWGVQ